MSALAFFLNIATHFEKNFRHIERGSVLSSPALEYKGRAFAFCRNDNMVIKLHEHTSNELNKRNIRTSGHYAPFGDSLKLNSWIQIPYYFHKDWEELAALALEDLQSQVG
jgi:hypothetical protein